MGLLGASEGLSTSTQLSQVFQHSWADNADALAMAYVGTPALKTDFTRTGKRTLRGALKDAYHSSYRYLLGNFTDAFRQDSFDLFLVNYRCDLDENKRREDVAGGERGSGGRSSLALGYRIVWQLKVFALLLAFSMLMIFATLFGDRAPMARFVHVMIWVAVSAGTGKVVLLHGPQFVVRPQLCPEPVQHGSGGKKADQQGRPGGHHL